MTLASATKRATRCGGGDSFKGVKKNVSKLFVRNTSGMGKGLYWNPNKREFGAESVWCVRKGTLSPWRSIIGVMDDPWRVTIDEWFGNSMMERDGDGHVGLKVFSSITGDPVHKSINCRLTRSEKVLSDDVGIQVQNYVYYDRTLIKQMNVVPPTCDSEPHSYVDVPRKCNWYRLNHLNEPNVSLVLKELECGRKGIVFYWNKDTPPTANEQLGFDYGDVPQQWRVRA